MTTPGDSTGEALSLNEALQRAAVAYRSGQLATSERLCRLILEAQPEQFEARYLLGIIALQTQRAPEAAELLRLSAAARPDTAVVHNDYAGALRELGRLEEALSHYDHALRINPEFLQAHFNRGAVLHVLGRCDAALESFQQALRIRPDFAEAYVSRGSVLHDLKRIEEELDSYQQALNIRPQLAPAHFSRGNVLHELGRFEEALASYDQAIIAAPRYAEAYNNRGVTLQQLRRPGEALESYRQALEIKPDYAEAHYNYAGVLKEQGQHEDALRSYQRALALRPEYADALTNLGIVQHRLQRVDDALASYQSAQRLRPEAPWLYGTWLHAKMQLCEWDAYDSEVAELTRRITSGQRATGPFPLLAVTDSPALQLRAAEIWARHSYPATPALPPIEKRRRGRTIRVGYFSADLQDHATAHLAAELFEKHDRQRFEIVAFSYGADDASTTRKRLETAFDRFLDVRAKSPLEIAGISRDLSVDIAVDLMGYTQNQRAEVFAHRAAPVQVGYLGYPGTMGAPFIDYIVADRTLIPEHSRRYYSEKIAYLPNSYQVNDRRRRISGQHPARADLGLPPSGFVYCCFNGSFKITPETFDGWMRILREVGGSVLWLLGGNERAMANMRRRAEAGGVDAARLVFAERLPTAQHLARYASADLFVDTFPCNAHTTASDALWGGLPVLTRCGETFAARVAASLLHAVGLPDLVTTTQQQYEATAIELAARRDLLAAARNKLWQNRLTAPLFDSGLYTRHLEDAYEQMYARYEADLPPAHLFIAP